mmetsp:Transcript_75284/g.133080  ORF Transcript_75284/g.133080 Transcript_75284/m.133080 type:complete len:226 (+) Transcript_75284:1640-2317(+)
MQFGADAHSTQEGQQRIHDLHSPRELSKLKLMVDAGVEGLVQARQPKDLNDAALGLVVDHLRQCRRPRVPGLLVGLEQMVLKLAHAFLEAVRLAVHQGQLRMDLLLAERHALHVYDHSVVLLLLLEQLRLGLPQFHVHGPHFACLELSVVVNLLQLMLQPLVVVSHHPPASEKCLHVPLFPIVRKLLQSVHLTDLLVASGPAHQVNGVHQAEPRLAGLHLVHGGG